MSVPPSPILVSLPEALVEGALASLLGVAEFCYEMGVEYTPPPPFHSPDLQPHYCWD